MKRQGLPPKLRLKQRRQFLRVQFGGRKVHTRHFLVFVRRRDDAAAGTRLGITVTRKVANAVGRNRIKRLVREAFRRQRETVVDGFDLVWVAKRDAATATWVEVAGEMSELAAKLARR
jgi:ribonuclease P protein component